MRKKHQQEDPKCDNATTNYLFTNGRIGRKMNELSCTHQRYKRDADILDNDAQQQKNDVDNKQSRPYRDVVGMYQASNDEC